MDKKRVDEIQRLAQEAVDAGNPEEAERILREAMQEAAGAGFSVQVNEVQSIANFVQKAVDTALAELVQAAGHAGVPFVPVKAIESLIGRQATGVRMLWETMDTLQVPVDYGVPDDLSEMGEV